MRSQRLMIQAKSILTFAWMYGWLAVIREPYWLVTSITTPISIVFILTIFGGRGYMAVGLLGGLAMEVSTSGGFTIIGDAAYLRLELKMQSMFMTSMLNPISYTLGLALSELIYAIPGIALFAIMVSVMLHPTPMASAIAFLILTAEWVASSMMGFALSTLVTDTRYGWALSGLLSFMLGTLPPVFYPATRLPSPYIALVSPISSVATVLQYYMLHMDYPLLLIRLCILEVALEAVLFTLIAFYKSRWRSVK